VRVDTDGNDGHADGVRGVGAWRRRRCGGADREDVEAGPGEHRRPYRPMPLSVRGMAEAAMGEVPQ
jgi:hypothetical protein